MNIQYELKLIAYKEKVYKLKMFMEQTHKKTKVKTKHYDKVLNAINNFLKCNLSDKSIFSKYEVVKNLIDDMPSWTKYST